MMEKYKASPSCPDKSCRGSVTIESDLTSVFRVSIQHALSMQMKVLICLHDVHLTQLLEVWDVTAAWYAVVRLTLCSRRPEIMTR